MLISTILPRCAPKKDPGKYEKKRKTIAELAALKANAKRVFGLSKEI